MKFQDWTGSILKTFIKLLKKKERKRKQNSWNKWILQIQGKVPTVILIFSFMRESATLTKLGKVSAAAHTILSLQAVNCGHVSPESSQALAGEA